MSKKYINLEHTIRNVVEKKIEKESGNDSVDTNVAATKKRAQEVIDTKKANIEARKDAEQKYSEGKITAQELEDFYKETPGATLEPGVKQAKRALAADSGDIEKRLKGAETTAAVAGLVGAGGVARTVAKRIAASRASRASRGSRRPGVDLPDIPTPPSSSIPELRGVTPTHTTVRTSGSDITPKRKSNPPKLKEQIGFGSDEYKGVPSVFTRPIPKIGPGHERSSEKNSSLRKTNKQINSQTMEEVENVARSNQNRKTIKNVARPDSETPKSSKSELAKQGHIKTKIIDESISKHIFVSILKESVLSAYSPQSSNRNKTKKMEGGLASSRPGPGQNPKDAKTWKVKTLDQYNPDDPASYVTIAGHPSHYGKKKTIDKISYTTPSGETKELSNVRGYVHDTGRAFKGASARKGVRFDIPVGQDMAGYLGNQPFSMKKHAVMLGWDEPQTKKPEPPTEQPTVNVPKQEPEPVKPTKRTTLNALSRNIQSEKENEQKDKDRKAHDEMWAGSTNAPKEYESGGKRKNNKNPLVMINPPLKHDIQEQSPQRRPGLSGQMQRNLRVSPAGTIATIPDEERQEYKDVIRTLVPGVDAYQKYKEGDTTGAAISGAIDVATLGGASLVTKGGRSIAGRFLGRGTPPQPKPPATSVTPTVPQPKPPATSVTPTVPQPKPPATSVTPTVPQPKPTTTASTAAATVGTGLAASAVPLPTNSSSATPPATSSSSATPTTTPSPAQGARAASEIKPGESAQPAPETKPKETPSSAPTTTPQSSVTQPRSRPSTPSTPRDTGELPDWKKSLERTGGFSFEDGGKKKRKMSESIVLNYIQNTKKINK